MAEPIFTEHRTGSWSRMLLIVLVVAGIAAVGYAIYLTAPWNMVGKNDRQVYDEALVASQQLDMGTSAERYAALADAENDVTLRLQYRTLEGLNRLTARDHEAGMRILKEVVADPQATAAQKAAALIVMTYPLYTDDIEGLRVLFAGEEEGIYAQALGDGEMSNLNALRRAGRELYKTANTYHPYAFANYALALSPSELVRADSATEEEIESARTAVEEYLEQGDVLLAAERDSGLYVSEEPHVMRDFLFMAMHFRLLAIEALAREDEAYRTIADSYYVQVVDFFEGFDLPAVRSQEAYVRYYYAAYLADVYGAERSSEIAEVLAPLTYETGVWVQSNSFSIWSFLANELNDGTLFSEGENIRALAELDPGFKAFLEKRGWFEAGE